MSKFIPQEVVELILSKLPIKSLLRFLTVSKKWYKLIPSLKLDNRCHQLFVGFYHNRRYDFCIVKNGSFEEYVTYDVGLEGGYVTLVANGLICFYVTYSQVAFLWNPSTRRSFRLPESDIKPQAKIRQVLGVVLDHITCDYKILRMVIGDHDIPEIVEIFRLSTGSWEVVNGKVPDFGIYSEHCQVDLNGISYWMAYDYNFNPMLVSFDGHEELFGSVDLDIHGYPNGYANHWLLLLKESLIIVTTDNKGNFKIWKMEPSESFSLSLWCQIYFDVSVHVSPLGFRENGDFLWLIHGYLQYVSITLAHGFTTRSISVDADNTLRCRGPNYLSFSLTNYVESLDLLDLSLKQSQHPSL